MTNYEWFKSLSREELIEFFSKISLFEDFPWNEAFSSICAECMKTDGENVMSYCEQRNYTCRYFPESVGGPTDYDMINWWFDREHE